MNNLLMESYTPSSTIVKNLFTISTTYNYLFLDMPNCMTTMDIQNLKL
jgi:hypothetical protein